MGAGLLVFVAVIYAVVALSYASDARYGMALAFLAYAAANLGFAWDIGR